MVAAALVSLLLAAIPGWTAMPLRTGEPKQYAHYVRTEPDGTKSEITAAKRKCDCQPADAAQMLTQAVSSHSPDNVKREKAPMCGVSAEHIVVTGLSNEKRGTHNIDAYFLRKNGTFYSIAGYFDSGTIPADMTAALSKLCP